MKHKRKKAWVGAAISTIGSIVGSIISSNMQKRALEEQERKKQGLENYQNNMMALNNLNNSINGSQDAVEDYYNKQNLKCGGRYKRAAWGTQDTNSVISGLGSTASSIINAMIAAKNIRQVEEPKVSPIPQFQSKQLSPSTYNRIQPTQYVFRNGGRKIARGGTRKRGKNEYNGEPNKSKNYYVDAGSKRLIAPLNEKGEPKFLMEDGPGIVGGGMLNANYDVFYKNPRITSDNEGITQEYETQLNPKEEEAFQNWYKSYSRVLGLDSNPDHPAHQYDYRGYWLNELKGGNENTPIFEHLPDTYKRPGHPTFSKESIYSTPETPGGRWNGDTFIPSWFNNVVNGDLDGNKAVFKNGELVGRLLPEIVVEAPRKRKGNKYKRK